MPTVEILTGPRFSVHAWLGSDGKCDVLEFLEMLEADGNPDYDRLWAVIRRSASEGVPQNKTLVNSLGSKIFEFKGKKNASRIAFFYDKERLIICSHGFSGKKGNEKKFIARQIDIAKEIRKAYRQEKGEENV